MVCLQAEKARSWFRRAVLLDPNVGDFWALLYNFEMQQKPPHPDAVAIRDVAVSDIIKQCISAAPHYGERWQRNAKAIANIHAKSDALLKLSSADLLTQPPP